MRFSQLVLLVAVASCSNVAAAEDAAKIQNLAANVSLDVHGERHSYLKDSETSTDRNAAGEERAGASTGLEILPKLHTVSNFPGV
ncbi:hypothetical protein GQ600_26222 [Phytophthora cactorum]|nr:hypothetical protein GQ600_26222 [Phytophthora cactorum]